MSDLRLFGSIAVKVDESMAPNEWSLRPSWACGKCDICGGWMEHVEPYGPGCSDCWDGALPLIVFWEAVLAPLLPAPAVAVDEAGRF